MTAARTRVSRFRSSPMPKRTKKARRGSAMKGYGLFYFVAEAFRGLRANSLVNLLAVSTITMAMVIVGFFLIVFLNLQAAVDTLVTL